MQKIIFYFKTSNYLFFLESTGAVLGALGAILMAIDPAYFSAISFPLWLASSLLLASFAYFSSLKFLLGLQITFVVINIFGVLRNTF